MVINIVVSSHTWLLKRNQIFTLIFINLNFKSHVAGDYHVGQCRFSQLGIAVCRLGLKKDPNEAGP